MLPFAICTCLCAIVLCGGLFPLQTLIPFQKQENTIIYQIRNGTVGLKETERWDCIEVYLQIVYRGALRRDGKQRLARQTDNTLVV